jgi:betaine reductase
MIEKAGIPAAHLAAMTSMAKVAGSNRIISSGQIPHPVGDPSRSADEELKWRKGRVNKALEAVTTPLTEALIFPEW